MRARILALTAIAVLLLGSCELALGPRSEGTLVLNLGGGPASRALSDPPFLGLPVFSSVTVTVSGSGMPTASLTAPGDTGSVTVQVPAGPARKVEVHAVPDWVATALQGLDPLPTLAKAYGGTVVVDVAGGQRVNIDMDMDVVETKIVLPDSASSRVYFVNSIDETPPTEFIGVNSSNKYYAFDHYGRIFLRYGAGAPFISLFSNPTQLFDSTPLTYDFPFAYSRNDNALYFAVSSTLYFVDLSSDPVVETDLGLPVSINSMQTVAVDPDGHVYVAGDTGEGDYSVVKLAIDAASGLEVRLLKMASYASLGLNVGLYGNLQVKDMTVRNGRLYIAAAENSDVHHGKVVEVSLSDLTKTREIGWSTTTPTSPSTQFYGPSRFLAIVPRKLIVADEGYDGSNDRNRIVEIDIDSWNMTAANTTVTFFNSYFC